MAGLDQPTLAPTPDDFTDELPCPRCGYDLRATNTDHCSECGQPIDRAALRTSAFPWSRRHEIGRLRAYLQTAWLITIDSRRLRYEASKPQDPIDARTFRRITTALLATVFVSLFVIFAAPDGNPTALAGALWWTQNFMAPWNQLPSWLGDILVPLAAGLTIPLLIPALLIGLAIHLTASVHHLFRVREASRARQQYLLAIAQYSLAPIVWLLPPILCFGLFLATFLPELNEGGVDHTSYIIKAVAALALITLATHALQRRFRSLRGSAADNFALSLRLAKWVLAITFLMTLWPLSRALAHLSLDDLAFLPPFLVALLALALTSLTVLLRITQWAIRAHLGDFLHVLLALLRLLGVWLIALLTWFALVPWCFGFLSIAFGFR